jgi:hypothetical protein
MDLAARGWGLAYVDEVVAHHHPSLSRDPSGRRRVQVRNALWSAWLRRPLGGAARQTAQLAVLALHQRGARSGILLALLGLPWVLRERRPVPPNWKPNCAPWPTDTAIEDQQDLGMHTSFVDLLSQDLTATASPVTPPPRRMESGASP